MTNIICGRRPKEPRLDKTQLQNSYKKKYNIEIILDHPIVSMAPIITSLALGDNMLEVKFF